MPATRRVHVVASSDPNDLHSRLAAEGYDVAACALGPVPSDSEDGETAAGEAAAVTLARAHAHCRAAQEAAVSGPTGPAAVGPQDVALGIAHRIVGDGEAGVRVLCAAVAVNLGTAAHREVIKEDVPRHEADGEGGPGASPAAVHRTLLGALIPACLDGLWSESGGAVTEEPTAEEEEISPQGLSEELKRREAEGRRRSEGDPPLPPRPVERVVEAHVQGLNCNAADCMRCGVSFERHRRIWCPKCNATICAACSSSPVVHVRRTRPTATCRSCAKLGCHRCTAPTVRAHRSNRLASSVESEIDSFRLKSTQEIFMPADLDDEAPAYDDACEGCNAPFSFFRQRTKCAQCDRIRCAKCLVQKPHSPDVTRLCGECLYGPDFGRRRVGIDPTVVTCLVCDAAFSFFRRRHWCRRCGRTICSGCSSTPISTWSRRHPKCICKRCFVPKIFRLPYELAQYMMEFVDQDGRLNANRVCKRFNRLMVMPFNAINRVDDYYVVDTKKDLLGEGAFGMVYAAVCRRTGEPRAIKVISKKKLFTYEKVKVLEREISIHMQLDHPNTVPLFETMQTNTEVLMVMGQAGKFDLVDYLLGRHRVPEAQVIQIAVQVLQFLHYLHADKYTVHRDLKLDNVMMSDEGNVLVRVIDFGLAKVVGPPPEVDRTDPISFHNMASISSGDGQGSTAPSDWSPLPHMTPPNPVRIPSSPHDTQSNHSASPPVPTLPAASSSRSGGSPITLGQPSGPQKSRSRSPRRRDSSSAGGSRRSDVGVLCTPCGTLRYCAPEVLAVRSHHQKVPHVAVFKRDIFSLGVLLYALLCGRLPYESNTVRQLRREMARPLSFRGGEDLSADCKSFIASLCTLKPYYRPSAQSALTHVWLMGTGRLMANPVFHNIQPEFRRRRQLERERGIEHDRPFMQLKVEEDDNGTVVAEHVPLSGYFNRTQETVATSEVDCHW